MLLCRFFLLALIFLAPAQIHAGGKIRLDKQKKLFFVPRDVSLIRVVRLEFHPTQPEFLIGQITDRRLAVWNLNDPRPEKATKENRDKNIPPVLCCEYEFGWIRGFDIHPNGKEIAAGGSDRFLKVWSWSDGKVEDKPVREVKAHDGWIEAVAYSPDGKWLATASSDLTVKLWDASGLKLVHTFTGHTGFARDVAWSPNGKLLVSGGEDGKVMAWDVSKRSLAWEAEFGNTNDQSGQNPRFSGVMRVSIDRDGQFVSAIGRDKLLVFEAKTGEAVASDRASYDTIFHPRQDWLLGGTDRTYLWNINADKLQPPTKKNARLPDLGSKSAEFRRQGEGVAFSPDGQWLAVTERETTVAIYKVSH